MPLIPFVQPSCFNLQLFNFQADPDSTQQDRLRLKIARCRSQPELLTAQNPKGLGQRSVALEIERELGKGPLKAEDLGFPR